MGAQGRCNRGAEARTPVLCRLHRLESDAEERWQRRSAGGTSARGGRAVAQEPRPHRRTVASSLFVSDRSFLDYFKCPERMAAISSQSDLCATDGFFRFDDAIGFGRCAGRQRPATHADDQLPEMLSDVIDHHGKASLPFDLTEVVTNLREERYRRNGYSFLQKTTASNVAHRVYYTLRPFMALPVRKQLQKLRLTGWERIPFPRWPVDVSVDQLMRNVMALLLKRSERSSIPFIWFWPDGAPAAAMVTHD